MSVFKKRAGSHLSSNIFFGERVDIARYDEVKYPALEKLTNTMLGFFWRPEEVNITKDKSDFVNLSDKEKHIFTANLKRQILLDSVQGRGPTETFIPIASLPEIEPLVQTWAFMETIHSRSYTHIIRNIYPNPSEVFDTMLDISEILDCGDSISKYYDDFIEASKWWQLLGEGTHIINGKEFVIDLYELKKKLWYAINSINILEGVRFYVSFACSWAFAENKLMEGNAKIIKLIARDENTHLAASQMIIKNLVKEDPDFAKISVECHDYIQSMFIRAADQERNWASYLFKDGSMLGLSENILVQYIEWIVTRRMRSLGYTSPYHVQQTNPLPWTEKYIGGGNVQVAPQQTQISSYVIGGVNQDMTAEKLQGLSL
jgi:ribonucleoside-diphosphate reductase beta chain